MRAQLVAVPAANAATPANPALARLVSGGDIGDLGMGQATSIQINAAPAPDAADGYYQYELRITADNDRGGQVPVTIAVAQSGEGGARFKMVDIYTNTLDASGNPIAGLSGASIKLQNEALTANITTLTSDEQGIAHIANLAPGNYRWRASAKGHTDGNSLTNTVTQGGFKRLGSVDPKTSQARRG